MENKTIIGFLILIAFVIAGWVLIDIQNRESVKSINETEITINDDDDEKEIGDTMNLVVFLQDKKVAESSDCGATYSKTITVPQTVAVAEASLEYLFANELSQYGDFGSVIIKDSVAQVTIVNEQDPDGLWISSLSSCESRHLTSVLNDTLTQYDSIDSVELYSLNGKIEF